jgi:protein-S-isoprenylcysteine O-methyltransferase Ste14
MGISRRALQRYSKPLTITVAALGGAVIGFYFTGDAAPVHSLAEGIAEAERRGLPPPMLVSLAMWVVLSVYWEISARKAAAKVSSESAASRGIHVALTSVAQLLLIGPVPGLRTRFVPLMLPLIGVGLGIELVSLALAIWARRCLGRNWSGAVATNVDHEMIRFGPYRFVRHPIYTGLLGLYFGTMVVSGEIHALLGMALAAFAYWRKIRIEEAHLSQLFGPAYEEYRSTTWALVPGLF